MPHYSNPSFPLCPKSQTNWTSNLSKKLSTCWATSDRLSPTPKMKELLQKKVLHNYGLPSSLNFSQTNRDMLISSQSTPPLFPISPISLLSRQHPLRTTKTHSRTSLSSSPMRKLFAKNKLMLMLVHPKKSNSSNSFNSKIQQLSTQLSFKTLLIIFFIS